MSALQVTPPSPSKLSDWPANAQVGYIVTPLGGGPAARVTVTSHGTLEIEGIGAYAIAETVQVAELRGAARR